MGKGKRIRDEKANKPITIGRGEFKAYMFNVVDHCDDESFNRLSQIFLMACGVIDSEGNLTEEYASSPYWTFKDGKMEQSEHAKLMRELLR